MSKRGTTSPLSVLFSAPVLAALRAEALDQQTSAAAVVRGLVHDHFTFFDLAPSMVRTLDADRERQELSRRDYLVELLADRYRELLAAGQAPRHE